MKAKLLKQFAYKCKEKQHYEHVIVIPDQAVTKLRWKGSQELELAVKDGKSIVEFGNEKPSKSEA
jgi:hypothetical protein